MKTHNFFILSPPFDILMRLLKLKKLSSEIRIYFNRQIVTGILRKDYILIKAVGGSDALSYHICYISTAGVDLPSATLSYIMI
jgi:hypothetical protein